MGFLVRGTQLLKGVSRITNLLVQLPGRALSHCTRGRVHYFCIAPSASCPQDRAVRTITARGAPCPNSARYLTQVHVTQLDPTQFNPSRTTCPGDLRSEVRDSKE